MKVNSIVSKFLTNKWVLNIIVVLSFFNVIGYMIIGKINNILIFIVLAILVKYFTKNMIIVLGIPLLLTNLISLKINSIEGMKTQTHSETINKINENKIKNQDSPGSDKSNTNNEDINAFNSNKTDEHFEVGRPKNGASKIDYASTIEGAYDELNKVLGSDGIKNLTDDTQRLMKQQMELAESMKTLGPLVEKMMPMAQQMQGMMQGMNGNGGMSGLMDMAQKMAKGLGSTPNK